MAWIVQGRERTSKGLEEWTISSHETKAEADKYFLEQARPANIGAIGVKEVKKIPPYDPYVIKGSSPVRDRGTTRSKKEQERIEQKHQELISQSYEKAYGKERAKKFLKSRAEKIYGEKTAAEYPALSFIPEQHRTILKYGMTRKEFLSYKEKLSKERAAAIFEKQSLFKSQSIKSGGTPSEDIGIPYKTLPPLSKPLPLELIGIPYKMDLDAPAAPPAYSRYGQNLVMEAAPSESLMDWRKKAEEEAAPSEDLFGKIEERISFGGYIPSTKQMQLKMDIKYGTMIADKPSTSFMTDPKGWAKYGHGVFMGEALPAAVETAPYAAGFGFLTMAAPTAALVGGLAALPFYTKHLQEEIAEKGILRTSIIETPSLALYAGASKIGGELSKTSKFNVEAMFKRWRFERKIKMPVGEEWRGRSTFEPTGEMQFLAKRGAGVTYITKEIKPQGYKLNGETQLLIKPKKPPEFPELLETYLFLKEFAKLPEEKVRAMAILDKKASKDMAFQEMIREQPAPITEKGKAKMEFIEEQPLSKGIKKAKETKEQKYWKAIFRGKRGQAGLVFDIGGLIPPQIIKPSKYIDMPKSFRRAKPPKEDFIIRGKTEPSRDAFGLFPPILISKTDQLYKTQLTGQQPSPLDDLFKPKEDQDRKGKIIAPAIISEGIREQEKEKQKGRYTIFSFLDDPPLPPPYPPIDPETPPVFVEPPPETPPKFRGWMPKKDKRTTEPFDQGFNVFARERGRFVRVNKKPLLRQRAKNLGAEVVDNTSAASFVLRKTKREPANNLDDVLFFKRTKFRSPKTKSKLPPKTFIEKNNFRIDTAGERRGISARGWVANRRRAERRRAEGGLLMNFGGFGL